MVSADSGQCPLAGSCKSPMDVKVPLKAGIIEGILSSEEKMFLHRVRHLVMTRLVQSRVKPIY